MAAATSTAASASASPAGVSDKVTQRSGRKEPALTPRFVAGPYAYEVLKGVSRWIPDEAPEQLDALLARHFDTVPAHGN
jgi:hypothetical protein